MRDMYISVEALRNSTDLLHSKMNSWIVQRLDFREARGLDWVCRQRDLWTALGVEADIVELLATELELCFEGFRLCVKHGTKGCVQNIFCFTSLVVFVRNSMKHWVASTRVRQVDDQDLVETLATVLTVCWRFRSFTESRWLTVGTSCRTVAVAALLGLDNA